MIEAWLKKSIIPPPSKGRRMKHWRLRRCFQAGCRVLENQAVPVQSQAAVSALDNDGGGAGELKAGSGQAGARQGKADIRQPVANRGEGNGDGAAGDAGAL